VRCGGKEEPEGRLIDGLIDEAPEGRGERPPVGTRDIHDLAKYGRQVRLARHRQMDDRHTACGQEGHGGREISREGHRDGVDMTRARHGKCSNGTNVGTA